MKAGTQCHSKAAESWEVVENFRQRQGQVTHFLVPLFAGQCTGHCAEY